jgi:hypothetical protein
MMTRPNATSPNDARLEAQRRLRGTMGLLSVGLAVLAFLVAIDRPEWFHIRPATGTSIALSHAMGEASSTKAQ